uniref:RING-type E3 ubiquitin transferase n=1 Tax=Leersia perrieri TaxID=77586 RepID=A0A0D9XD84_9ORYZ
MSSPPPSKPKRRRLLSLPAVYPCEDITPAPLFASLLSLAADVAGRRVADADAFPILRRGVRRVVRIAGILLAFLEELHDATTSSIPASAVLALTELHVAMQKLRFLLTDVSRRGARLWVLVNAAAVASELRLVLGSFAAALDAMPSSVVEAASVETRELARLASEQAWRAAVRPDAADDRAARSVRSIVEQFRDHGGVAPDSDDVRRVLRRVRVGSWSDCSEEIAFLESELQNRLDAGDENSSDVVVINTLIAFMVYCRVVLFDHIDANKSQSSPATAPAAKCPDWIRPDALQCPITLDIMTDPVTVSTGQTYDRASITRWMKAGCRTCPVTGERLLTGDVVPNAALRGIVERMLLSNGVTLPDSTRHGAAANANASASAAACGAARLAVAHVVAQLSRGSTEERRKATAEARKLSKHSAFYRGCLVAANAVPWLLCLLSSTDAAVQDNAVASLLNLSKLPDGRAAIAEVGGVGLVVDVINVGVKPEARQNAAAILFYLSSSAQSAEEIGRIPEAIPTLVQLIRDGAYRGRKNGMVSLYGLLQCGANHGRAVAAGAVSALAAVMSSAGEHHRDDLAGDSVALLARIAEQPSGALAVLSQPGLVARLAEALAAAPSSSRSAKDHGVSLLASLCRHGGGKVVAMLGRMPLLMSSLYSLVADGSPQTSKKARALLNEIHRHYEMVPPPPTAPAPAASASSDGGDRVVRVL